MQGGGRREEGGYVQKGELEVAVDARLERDLDIQVEVQPQTQRVALAAVTAAALVERAAGDVAERVRHAARQALRRLADAVKAAELVEAAKGTAAAATALLPALLHLPRALGPPAALALGLLLGLVGGFLLGRVLLFSRGRHGDFGWVLGVCVCVCRVKEQMDEDEEVCRVEFICW